MDEGYYVGWGTLALINAGLAEVKGRSRLAWFIGSLLVGPIATLLLVLSEYRAPAGMVTPAAPAATPSSVDVRG
ncbi:MAG TPA: hypothetical protein VF039_08260 [Longimicrobiales bacterium]